MSKSESGVSVIFIFFILAVLGTSYFVFSLYKSGQINLPFVGPYKYDVGKVREKLYMESINWKRMNSQYYSFKIPASYKFLENQIISGDGSYVYTKDTDTIVSSEIPELKTVFTITIRRGFNNYGNIKQVVDFISSCNSITPESATKEEIDGNEALFYKDTSCGINGGTYIYVAQGKNYFEFKIISPDKFSFIEPYISAILSSFEFKTDNIN